MDEMTVGFEPVIEEIAGFPWEQFTPSVMTSVAWAYYYFSIQFRESLKATLAMYPDDEQLQQLVREECATDNLSPWPGVAQPGETLNHDEFMRRALEQSPFDSERTRTLREAGEHYLETTRGFDDHIKAMSIASYECGGLEAVFTGMLRAKEWDTPLLAAFRHFLEKHVSFDSDLDHGHGTLAHHLAPDSRVRSMWTAFRDLLLIAVPGA